MNLGTATVLYSCLVPVVDSPLADLDTLRCPERGSCKCFGVLESPAKLGVEEDSEVLVGQHREGYACRDRSVCIGFV